MDARNLVETLKGRGLFLRLDGDRIKVEASHEPDPETKALLWELRRYREEVKLILAELAEEDPILSPVQWYPHFRDYHHTVISKTPHLDWLWVKEHRQDLCWAIKAKENEIDALGPAPLSRVIEIMKEWRELVLKAEFERKGGA